MMLFERARWPVNDRPEVADAPCCGVRSVVTPGVMTEKLMKLRPLIGRLSICCRLSTDDTAVFVTSTTGDSPVTVNCSAVPATDNRKSTVTDWPRSSTMPVCVWDVKPCASRR